MLKGKTESGFEFEIDERLLDDYELVELLAETEENPLVISKVLTKLLGDQKKTLIEHVREEDGVVPASKMMEELEEIFSSSNQTKNS